MHQFFKSISHEAKYLHSSGNRLWNRAPKQQEVKFNSVYIWCTCIISGNWPIKEIITTKSRIFTNNAWWKISKFFVLGSVYGFVKISYNGCVITAAYSDVSEMTWHKIRWKIKIFISMNKLRAFICLIISVQSYIILKGRNLTFHDRKNVW